MAYRLGRLLPGVTSCTEAVIATVRFNVGIIAIVVLVVTNEAMSCHCYGTFQFRFLASRWPTHHELSIAIVAYRWKSVIGICLCCRLEFLSLIKGRDTAPAACRLDRIGRYCVHQIVKGRQNVACLLFMTPHPHPDPTPTFRPHTHFQTPHPFQTPPAFSPPIYDWFWCISQVLPRCPVLGRWLSVRLDL